MQLTLGNCSPFSTMGREDALQHGSAGEPGSITSRSHQHTDEPFCRAYAQFSGLAGPCHQRGYGTSAFIDSAPLF